MDLSELSMSDSPWTSTIVLFFTCIFLTFSYFKYKFSYWSRRGIFQVPGKIPCGALTPFIISKTSIAEVIRDIYFEGKNHKYLGYYSFTTPGLVIRDLELIKNILVKDFNYFSDRGIYYNEREDALSAHLFALRGNKWKYLRSKLSPTFTSGKMKFMYETIKICTFELRDYLIEITNKNDEIDLKHIIAKHGVNVIANTAIGIEGHSIKDDSKLCEVAFKVTDSNMVQAFRFILPIISKNVARMLRLRLTPKDTEEYYLDMVGKIIEYRIKNKVQRNDFMHLLIESWTQDDGRKNNENYKDLSLKDLAAQTFIFILGSYETGSATICFSLYELAMNKIIQDKLIKEIDSVGDDVTYDQINNLKYLDMILNETLRKYPPAGFIFRESNSDYDMKDGNILEKGMSVIIPVLALHNDPDYFPNPDKYDPERFNKDSPSQDIKPFTYLPFGEGQRYCIAKRFGILQAKLSLFVIMSQFRVEISDKTVVPPVLDPKAFLLHSTNGMHLRVINRKK